MKKKPLVSVILPVYNGDNYLAESVKSVLDQTYDNFEVILIDDGSKDKSVAVAKRFDDKRIRMVVNRENKGLAASLNKAIALCEGDLVARQDQDDIAKNERLRKQVAFLERNLDVDMVGTWAEVIHSGTLTERKICHPIKNYHIQFKICFDNTFVHSSMMMRKSMFEKVGVYETGKERQPPEDYELWSRVVRKCKVANIAEVLVSFRVVETSMTKSSKGAYWEKILMFNRENIKWLAGDLIGDDQIDNILLRYHGLTKNDEVSIREIKLLLNKMAERISRRFPEECSPEDFAGLKSNVIEKIKKNSEKFRVKMVRKIKEKL